MLIFTPGVSFEHAQVIGLEILKGFSSDSAGAVEPRLAVRVVGNSHIFFGAEAYDVLNQMRVAGVLSSTQSESVRGRLADEIEMFSVSA